MLGSRKNKLKKFIFHIFKFSNFEFQRYTFNVVLEVFVLMIFCVFHVKIRFSFNNQKIPGDLSTSPPPSPSFPIPPTLIYINVPNQILIDKKNSRVCILKTKLGQIIPLFGYFLLTIQINNFPNSEQKT